MSTWKSLGPGILFAGAAIGTSHLVQSTRAGAMFGLGLLAVVIVVNFIKYPAYRFGPQYAAATGKSLLEGYRDLGRWVVGLYVLIELAVISIIIAATGIVTSGILLAITELDADARYTGCALIALATLLLWIGGYKLLDRVTKLFVAILTIATVVAAFLSLSRVEFSLAAFALPTLDMPTFAFVIALMGFMPAGMELSVIQSLWSVAKAKTTGQSPSMKTAMLDFNIGYFGSAVLAVCFLIMGAGVMFAENITPESSAAGFAAQVVALYTTNLGNWAGTMVGVSAFFVMFTTLLTVLDGMPRLVATGMALLGREPASTLKNLNGSPLLISVTVLLALSSVLVLLFLMGNFQAFVDFVTITAFVAAPLTAALNHIVMVSTELPKEYQPSAVLRLWSLFALVFLTLLTLAFLYARFVA